MPLGEYTMIFAPYILQWYNKALVSYALTMGSGHHCCHGVGSTGALEREKKKHGLDGVSGGAGRWLDGLTPEAT